MNATNTAAPAGDRRAAPADMEALAWLLDNSIPIPGTGWRVGLDALIGLIPGVGDVVSGGLGLLVIARGAQLGLPGVVLARMLANVALDLLTGLIPVLGDAFDAWYKSNLRNVDLVRRHMQEPDAPTTDSWAFFLGLLLAIAALMAGAIWLIGQLVGALFG